MKGIRARVAGRLSRSETGRRLLNEPRYRVIYGAAWALAINMLYALYNGALGIVNRSIWFMTMSAYYSILSMTRFSAVLCERRSGGAEARGTEFFVMKLTGALLAVLSITMGGVIHISLAQDIAVRHGTIVMITIAAYTFYKITMAIIRAVKQRKNPSPLLAVIRGIGYADVAASVFTLQRSMIVSFNGMPARDAFIMNVLVGFAACVFILAIGISMIVRGIKKGS